MVGELKASEPKHLLSARAIRKGLLLLHQSFLAEVDHRLRDSSIVSGSQFAPLLVEEFRETAKVAVIDNFIESSPNGNDVALPFHCGVWTCKEWII